MLTIHRDAYTQELQRNRNQLYLYTAGFCFSLMLFIIIILLPINVDPNPSLFEEIKPAIIVLSSMLFVVCSYMITYNLRYNQKLKKDQLLLTKKQNIPNVWMHQGIIYVIGEKGMFNFITQENVRIIQLAYMKRDYCIVTLTSTVSIKKIILRSDQVTYLISLFPNAYVQKNK